MKREPVQDLLHKPAKHYDWFCFWIIYWPFWKNMPIFDIRIGQGWGCKWWQLKQWFVMVGPFEIRWKR